MLPARYDDDDDYDDIMKRYFFTSKIVGFIF